MTPIALKHITDCHVYARCWLHLVTRGYTCETNKTSAGWSITITDRPATQQAIIDEMTKFQVKQNKALERQCLEAVHSNKSTADMQADIARIFELPRKVEALSHQANGL